MDQGREKNGPVRHVNKMDFCSTTSFPITMSFHLSLPTTRPHSEIYIFGAVQFRTSLFASFDCFLLSRPREIYEIQKKKRNRKIFAVIIRLPSSSVSITCTTRFFDFVTLARLHLGIEGRRDKRTPNDTYEIIGCTPDGQEGHQWMAGSFPADTFDKSNWC